MKPGDKIKADTGENMGCRAVFFRAPDGSGIELVEIAA